MKKKSGKADRISTDSGAAPTTIVGGQPRSKTRKVNIPIGIEQLIYKAAQDLEFRDSVLDDPVAAAGRAGIKLTDFERTTLSYLKPEMLSAMIERFHAPKRKKGRLGRIAAAVALTLASGTAASGCGDSVDYEEEWRGGDGGTRADTEDAGVRYDDDGTDGEDGGAPEED